MNHPEKHSYKAKKKKQDWDMFSTGSWRQIMK